MNTLCILVFFGMSNVYTWNPAENITASVTFDISPPAFHPRVSGDLRRSGICWWVGHDDPSAGTPKEVIQIDTVNP